MVARTFTQHCECDLAALYASHAMHTKLTHANKMLLKYFSYVPIKFLTTYENKRAYFRVAKVNQQAGVEYLYMLVSIDSF